MEDPSGELHRATAVDGGVLGHARVRERSVDGVAGGFGRKVSDAKDAYDPLPRCGARFGRDEPEFVFAHGGQREAMEETGLRLSDLEPAGALWTMPGCATEKMHLYLAPYGAADKVGAGGGAEDEHEEIEVVEMPAAEAVRQATSGEICDMKTVFLLQALRLRRPELF